jgi:hypothetical protein
MKQINFFLVMLSLMIMIPLTSTAAEKQKKESPVISQQPSGIVCLTNMKNVIEPRRQTLRRVVINTMDSEGKTNEFVIGQAYKNLTDEKQMVLTFLEPEGMKGVVYLFKERENNLKTWVYLTSIRRVREISAPKADQPYENFLTTDFTVSDIGFATVPQVCQLSKAKKHAGKNAYKVEEKIPGEAVYYSRIITWVGADDFSPIQRDYYNAAGELWKSLFFKNIVTIDKATIPLLLQMKDLQRGTTTDLIITDVVNDVNIPDDLFIPQEMSKVADSPLWKMVMKN